MTVLVTLLMILVFMGFYLLFSHLVENAFGVTSLPLVVLIVVALAASTMPALITNVIYYLVI
jgi:hypothetical protein